ncbi:MAG TPA: ATP-binding cassette domain-containing protein [Sedimentisphaerales bacterium]|nr:ATP-binding cassette domain-containing protein [Sedimentisphaerales bacterium]
MIIAQNLEYSYDTHRRDFKLECASFRAFPSEITCIIGSNGSGKTTLLKLLSGAVKPQSGSIMIAGETLIDLPKSKVLRVVGRIDAAASKSLVDELLVADHLALALATSGEPVPFFPRLLNSNNLPAQSRLGNELTSEIKKLLYKRVAELSSGQKQTITIALAIMNERKVILADEGAVHLDVKNARRFFNNMRRIALQNALACVVVTHDLSLVAEFADRIYTLQKGRVGEMKRNPNDDIKSIISRLEKLFS